MNLKKERLAVYAYLLLVLTMIFGLSFTVQGSRITGNFILDAADFVTGISMLHINMLLFGLLSFFVLVLMVHGNIKRDGRKGIRLFAGIAILLVGTSLLSFGIYRGFGNDITGAAVGMESVSGMQTSGGVPLTGPASSGLKDGSPSMLYYDRIVETGRIDPKTGLGVMAVEINGRFYDITEDLTGEYINYGYNGQTIRFDLGKNNGILDRHFIPQELMPDLVPVDPNDPSKGYRVGPQSGASQEAVEVADSSYATTATDAQIIVAQAAPLNVVKTEPVKEGGVCIVILGCFFQDYVGERVIVKIPDKGTVEFTLEPGTSSIKTRILEIARNPSSYSINEIKEIALNPELRLKLLEIYEKSTGRRAELDNLGSYEVVDASTSTVDVMVSVNGNGFEAVEGFEGIYKVGNDYKFKTESGEFVDAAPRIDPTGDSLGRIGSFTYKIGETEYWLISLGDTLVYRDGNWEYIPKSSGDASVVSSGLVPIPLEPGTIPPPPVSPTPKPTPPPTISTKPQQLVESNGDTWTLQNDGTYKWIKPDNGEIYLIAEYEGDVLRVTDSSYSEYMTGMKFALQPKAVSATSAQAPPPPDTPATVTTTPPAIAAKTAEPNLGLVVDDNNFVFVRSVNGEWVGGRNLKKYSEEDILYKISIPTIEGQDIADRRAKDLGLLGQGEIFMKREGYDGTYIIGGDGSVIRLYSVNGKPAMQVLPPDASDINTWEWVVEPSPPGVPQQKPIPSPVKTEITREATIGGYDIYREEGTDKRYMDLGGGELAEVTNYKPGNSFSYEGVDEREYSVLSTGEVYSIKLESNRYNIRYIDPNGINYDASIDTGGTITFTSAGGNELSASNLDYIAREISGSDVESVVKSIKNLPEFKTRPGQFVLDEGQKMPAAPQIASVPAPEIIEAVKREPPAPVPVAAPTEPEPQIKSYAIESSLGISSSGYTNQEEYDAAIIQKLAEKGGTFIISEGENAGEYRIEGKDIKKVEAVGNGRWIVNVDSKKVAEILSKAEPPIAAQAEITIEKSNPLISWAYGGKIVMTERGQTLEIRDTPGANEILLDGKEIGKLGTDGTFTLNDNIELSNENSIRTLLSGLTQNDLDSILKEGKATIKEGRIMVAEAEPPSAASATTEKETPTVPAPAAAPQTGLSFQSGGTLGRDSVVWRASDGSRITITPDIALKSENLPDWANQFLNTGTSRVYFNNNEVGTLNKDGSFTLGSTDDAQRFKSLYPYLITELERQELTPDKIAVVIQEGVKAKAAAAKPEAEQPISSVPAIRDQRNKVWYFDFFDPDISYEKVNGNEYRVDMTTGEVWAKSSSGKFDSLLKESNAVIQARYQAGYYYEDDNGHAVDPRTGQIYNVNTQTRTSNLPPGFASVKESSIGNEITNLDQAEKLRINIDSGWYRETPLYDGSKKTGQSMVQYHTYIRNSEGKMEKTKVIAYVITSFNDDPIEAAKFMEVTIPGFFQEKEYYHLDVELDGTLAKGEKVKGVNTINDIKKSSMESARQDRLNRDARALVNNMLHLILDDAINEQIEALCEAEEESSEANQAISINSPPPSLQSQSQGACAGSQLTTLTAQASKTTLSNGFNYQTSWTITACKQELQYIAYLANDLSDRIGIASGIAPLSEITASMTSFSYSSSYSFICLQVSDLSIGNNGYACFNVA